MTRRSKSALFDDVEAVVFDLDGTLMDFFGDAERAMQAAMERYDLMPDDWDAFFVDYKRIAIDRWHDFRAGRMGRDQMRRSRVVQSLSVHGIVTDRADGIIAEYMRVLCDEVRLVAGTREVLAALSRRYRLGLLTNGFVDSVAGRLARTGIGGYFEATVVAEEVMLFKPDLAIFEEMSRRLGVALTKMVYVGDSVEDDVVGAHNAGMRAIYYAGDDGVAGTLDPSPAAVVGELPELLDLL